MVQLHSVSGRGRTDREETGMLEILGVTTFMVLPTIVMLLAGRNGR